MICCFDIGGSKTVVADMGENQRPVIRHRQITPVGDYGAFRETVKAMAGKGTTPVGVSIAAVIDPHTGLARSANIPYELSGWEAERLERGSQLPRFARLHLGIR